MAALVDDLPGKLQLFTRDEIRDKYLRSYKIRMALGGITADISDGTQPFIDASTEADLLVPVYGNAKLIADNVALEGKSLASLQAYADTIGLVPNLLPASGSSGFAKVTASTAGGTIPAGTECKDSLGLRYQCAVTGLYGDGAQVPITAIDTGPNTNLAAGTVLQWTSPPAGIGPTCTVVEQSNGEGLQGGRDVETADELRSRISDRLENPPASGNDAEFQGFVENIAGLAIQKCFTWPCINGSGSTAIAFTMRPDKPGGSRIPNGTQIGQVQSQVIGAFPADDSLYFPTLVPSNVSVHLQVTWSKRANGWVDNSPWPDYILGAPIAVNGALTPTPTSCRLTSGETHADPVVGQTIGFYDASAQVFRRKQIKTITTNITGQSWDLTFETANNASDTTFTPAAGDVPSPWSDSLDLLVTPILQYFDSQIGPGEQVASPYDDGLRQKRQPETPEEWPSELTTRVLAPLYSLTAIRDINILVPTLPYATPVGTPGVSANLLELSGLAAFPP